jgi:hypothetical protein
MNIAGEPVELRDNDRPFQLAGGLDGGGQLGAAFQRIRTLACLDLGKSLSDRKAFRLGKAGNGFPLRFQPEAGATLALR